MSDLLKQLQKLKPTFPEAEFRVPEWARSVTLRGFSLREGRQLRPTNGADDTDNERAMLRTLAHAIVDGDDRPLANEDGIALLETLSAKTIQEMGQAFMALSGVGDQEGNSPARAGAVGSSSDSPSLLAEPSPSSKPN